MPAHRFASPLVVVALFAAATLTGPAAADEAWPWPNVRVSDDQWLAHSEPSIAQDPTDPDVLVGASKMFSTLQGGPNGYRFKVGTYRSLDGGKTWEDQGMLGGDDPNNDWSALGYGNTTDPSVVFDSSGNAYVEIMVYQGQQEENDLVVYKSTDKGETWTPHSVAHMPPGVGIVMDIDKNWLTADTTGGKFDGFLYSTWTYLNCVLTCHNVYFAASYDGGESWTPPKVISTTGSPLNQTSTPVVGPDGTIHVVFHDYSNHVLYMTTSSDAGATFTQPAPIANIVPPPSTLNGNVRSGPLVIGVPTVLDDGTIHVVWNQVDNGIDVVMATSTDGGATWSAPRTITGSTQGDQFQPWITTTRGGTIWTSWFDRRHDPSNLRIHVYAARSTDGGQTFEEFRVTDVDSDPQVGLPLDRGNRGFYGDYQGLVADDQTGANLLWNETRPGSQELFFARVNPEQTAVSATRDGDAIEVSGHAAFRSPARDDVATIAEDFPGDAPGGSDATGLDALGAKVYQPDPYVPELAFEWEVTSLPEPRGQVPEATRYLWAFNTGENNKQFQLQAKFSNFTSVTMLDEQEGHAEQAGEAFQLRGNCVTEYQGTPVANCPHVEWLSGFWDRTNDAVRIRLPIGASFAPEIVPGAELRPQDVAGSSIAAAYQAFVTNTTISDVVLWEAERPYTVPSKEAFVGTAPAGTPAGLVAFEPVSLDGSDDFTTTITAGSPDPHDVYLKACFDGRCEVTIVPAG